MKTTSLREKTILQSSMLPKLATCALILAATVLAALGQSQPAQDSAANAAAETRVVTLPVTVRDSHGKIVRDLTKDDFILEEDGRPQTIKSFSQEANLPLTLGLLVDTSYSQRNALDQERNASRSFFDQMVVPDKGRAFVIHFDREVELLQDLTSHHDKLEAALDLLKTSAPEPEQSNEPDDRDSRSGHRERSGRQLYDSVYLAANEVLKKPQGQKAIVVLSDGVDRGSKTTLASAIEAAQRSDTVVYSVFLKGEEEHGGRGGGTGRGGGYPGGGGGGGWPGGGGGWPGGGRRGGPGGGQRPSEEPRVDGKKIMEQIAKETGGRFFEVTKKQLVGDSYSSIAEELKTQYILSYTPDKESSANGYHHVQLQVKKKDMVVQTPEGYYADRQE